MSTDTTTTGIRYLDLDGDGVPDAVLTVETWTENQAVSNRATIVETLETGIGIDGHPTDVRVLSHH